MIIIDFYLFVVVLVEQIWFFYVELQGPESRKGCRVTHWMSSRNSKSIVSTPTSYLRFNKLLKPDCPILSVVQWTAKSKNYVSKPKFDENQIISASKQKSKRKKWAQFSSFSRFERKNLNKQQNYITSYFRHIIQLEFKQERNLRPQGKQNEIIMKFWLCILYGELNNFFLHLPLDYFVIYWGFCGFCLFYCKEIISFNLGKFFISTRPRFLWNNAIWLWCLIV